MNSKMVCIKCGFFLEQALQGMTVMEMAHFGPYKLWRADLWSCPGCALQIVAGFGDGPIAEHYQKEKFAKLRDAAEKRGTLVIACHRPQDRPSCPEPAIDGEESRGMQRNSRKGPGHPLWHLLALLLEKLEFPAAVNLSNTRKRKETVMLAREVLATVGAYKDSKVWLWIATTADTIEKDHGEYPWKKEWEEVCANSVEALEETWRRTMLTLRPPSPFGPWAVLVDLGGDYGGDRELYQFMPPSVHRSRAAEELAYALLCVALEAELKERRKDGD